jgi:hypothetical protein
VSTRSSGILTPPGVVNDGSVYGFRPLDVRYSSRIWACMQELKEGAQRVRNLRTAYGLVLDLNDKNTGARSVCTMQKPFAMHFNRG